MLISRPVPCSIARIWTRAPGSVTGSGFHTIALSIEKIVVFTPMPSATESTATLTVPGLRRSVRRPKRRSCSSPSVRVKNFSTRQLRASRPKQQRQQLCQLLPEHEHDVRSAVRAECVRNLRRIQPLGEGLRTAEKDVLGSAAHPDQPVVAGNRLRIREGLPKAVVERRWDKGAAQGRNGAKQLGMSQSDGHRELSAQREAGNRPRARLGLHSIELLQNRNQFVDDDRLEQLEVVVAP